MAKETAEAKLLKMMQKTGTGAVFSPGATARAKVAFAFSMRTLNWLLMLGIVICAVGLVYEMRSGMNMINQEINFSGDVKTPNAIAEIVLPASRDVKFYLEKIASRNIFRPYEEQISKEAGVQTLAKRLAKYKMVGVAWLDLPETASIMIENPESKTTYFLKQGEQLEGVTVKTIYMDRAVFSYENEETTIKL